MMQPSTTAAAEHETSDASDTSSHCAADTQAPLSRVADTASPDCGGTAVTVANVTSSDRCGSSPGS